MIIRVLHAKVLPGRQAEFKRIVELLSNRKQRSGSGMVEMYPGQTPGASSNEFILVTIWKNLSSLKKLPIEEWLKAILPEEAIPLIEEWRLQRYETFGIQEKDPLPLFKTMRYQAE